jgi:hypothetical protein
LSRWRIAVLKRDGYICQNCGQRAKTAHHIKTRKEHPELALEIDNGQCLCDLCHGKIHETMRNQEIAAEETGWFFFQKYLTHKPLPSNFAGIFHAVGSRNGANRSKDIYFHFTDPHWYIDQLLEEMVDQGYLYKRFGGFGRDGEFYDQKDGDDDNSCKAQA